MEGVPTSIIAEHNEDLLKKNSESEVKHALFQMHPGKSPGSNGMTPAFFQKQWHIVGKDIIVLVREFAQTGIMRNGLNETNVVLFLKKKHPTIISELRSISLCNVLAKIITKVLVNHMKDLLE